MISFWKLWKEIDLFMIEQSNNKNVQLGEKGKAGIFNETEKYPYGSRAARSWHCVDIPGTPLQT